MTYYETMKNEDKQLANRQNILIYDHPIEPQSKEENHNIATQPSSIKQPLFLMYKTRSNR